MPTGSLTLVGLGTGDPKHATVEAVEALRAASRSDQARVYAVPSVVGLATELATDLAVTSLADLRVSSGVTSPFEHIVKRLVTEAFRDGLDVYYRAPGHPLVLSDLGLLLTQTTQKYGFEVKVIAGLSFFDGLLDKLMWTGDPGLQLLSAPRVAIGHPVSQTCPTLLYEMDELANVGTDAQGKLATALLDAFGDCEAVMLSARPNVPGATDSARVALSDLAEIPIPPQSSLWVGQSP